MNNRYANKPPSEWTEAELADVEMVVMTTERDEEGISYGVDVSLGSLGETAYEQGEDRLGVWECRVEFGHTEWNRAGGGAFGQAAREQAQLADEIARIVWGDP